MKAALSVIAAALLVPFALAQDDDKNPEEDKKVTLDDFNLGKVVAGDKEVVDDLEGKVVVIEFWGPR